MNFATRYASLVGIALCALALMGNDSCLPEPCRVDGDCDEGLVCLEGECVEPSACVCPEIYAPVCGEDGSTYGNTCEADCAGVPVAHDGACEDECPPVLCLLACPYGFEVDETGCQTCDCAPPPLCLSDDECDDGFVCDRSECMSPPGCEAGEACPAVCYGQCVSDACICPDVWDPVCGEDGNTYGNSCEARCEGVQPDYRGECTDGCACDDVWDPVCGVDGATYGNPCEARCEGVEVDYRGECEDVCICTTEYAPVCGVDGTTYSNACAADCAGVEIDYRGECIDVCSCPEIWDPVCGVDGNTYGNGCFARCEDVDIAYDGECEDLCICTREYDPVCGVDGNTYSNACTAGCAGVEIDYRGECRVTCEDNGDCPRDQICYPPSDQCQPQCAIACYRYDPVCGTDGKTYGCGQQDAWCSGVEVAYEGECVEPCACPDVWAPVCGVDGETYGNDCEARCAEVEVAHNGPCLACRCAEDGIPVCGIDGRTYPDWCHAACAGMEIAHEGACEDCACPTDEWDPVCGVDGKTYGQPCEARCAGVEIAYRGECATRCESNADCEAHGEICNPGTHTCSPRCAVDCFRYDPVCGVDGETYGCGQPDAWCNGIEVAYEGECRDECSPVLCEMYCPFGWQVDDAGCDVCACNEPTPCMADRACGDGFRCDTENYCLSVGDLTVCYGACVRR